MKKFEGIYPALVTPYGENGYINPYALEQVLEKNIEKGVAGFYVGGSTGESLLLSVAERKELLEYTKKIVGERCALIANIGMFSTEESMDLARHAASVGVSAISAVPPFYFRFQDYEYLAYYKEITDAVSLPMILYNIPALTGVNISMNQLENFFTHANIIGVKHTSYDMFQLQKMLHGFPEKSFFIGHDELFLPGLSLGAKAAIGSSFNFMAEKFISLEQYFQENKIEKAQAKQNEINEIVTVLIEVGVFKGIKAALKMQGIDCGFCRKPFLPLSTEETKRLQQVLEETNCL